MNEENENASIFDATAFREIMVDEDLMREVIDEFKEESKTLLGAAEEALSGSDANALHAAAHALKGLVGNFCAERALERAAELDAAARAGDLEGAGQLYPRVEKEVGRLGESLAEFREELG